MFQAMDIYHEKIKNEKYMILYGIICYSKTSIKNTVFTCQFFKRISFNPSLFVYLSLKNNFLSYDLALSSFLLFN